MEFCIEEVEEALARYGCPEIFNTDQGSQFTSVAEARAGLGRYLNFYNGRRPHSSLGARTPDAAFFTQAPLLAVA